MKWYIANQNDYKDIISFLLNREWQHIQATSLYLKNFPNKREVITIIKRNNSGISSLISLSNRGMIYPVISPIDRVMSSDKEELIRLISSINIRIHGVIGLSDDVNFLDSIIFRRIRGKIDYLLMYRESEELFSVDNEGLYRAEMKDLNKLVELEYQYQVEEVLLNPKDLNKFATREHFKQKLRTNDMYFLRIGNDIVSKASTSQKSFNYTLVGGVFTWNHLRNRAYSTKLLQYLINDQFLKGYRSALFVNSDNTTAIHIYKKLGFVTPTPYKIHYYYV